MLLYLLMPLLLFAGMFAMRFFFYKKTSDPLKNLEQWPYQRKENLLNPEEINFYRALQQYLDQGLVALPKVQLQNLVFISPDHRLFGALHNNLADKYMDFTICVAESSRLVCAICFNDGSEPDNQQDQQEQLEKIFRNAHLPLLSFSPQYQYSAEDFALINQLYQSGQY